jgi:hypothetical protein
MLGTAHFLRAEADAARAAVDALDKYSARLRSYQDKAMELLEEANRCVGEGKRSGWGCQRWQGNSSGAQPPTPAALNAAQSHACMPHHTHTPLARRWRNHRLPHPQGAQPAGAPCGAVTRARADRGGL